MSKLSPIDTYLEHEDVPAGSIDVKLAVGRVVRIDTLAGEEVDDILRSVLIAIGCRDL